MKAPGKKILIVDDREINRKVLRVTLQAEGMEILEANDGIEALDVLNKHPVDCIITDILMPNLDGYRLCRRVRADKQLRDIPIIIYTATYLSSSDEQLAIKSGADRYLKKPSSAQEMLAAIEEVSKSVKRRTSNVPEVEVVKEYNELLIRKLEEKNIELQEQAAKLRESEEKLRQLVETDQQVFFLYDVKTGAALYVSPAYEKIWGKSCQSLYEQPLSWMDPIHPDDIAHVRDTLERDASTNYELEYRLMAPDKTIRNIMVRVAFLKDLAGTPLRCCGVALDVTDRKLLEYQAAAEHAVTVVLSAETSIKEAAPHIIQAICRALGWELGVLWTLDRDCKALHCIDVWHIPGIAVPTFEEMTRKTVFTIGIGLPGRVWERKEAIFIRDVIKDSNFPRAPYALKSGLHSAFAIPLLFDQEFLGVLEFFKRDVQYPDDNIRRMLESISSQIGQYLHRRKIEETLRQSEEQLRQSQKLEAVGHLAGGIAHDFNNLLTAIMGYSDLMLPTFEEKDARRDDIAEIKKTATRAAALTRQLLAFSRKQILDPKNIELNVIVSELGKMFHRLIGEDIQLSLILKSKSGLVHADPGQLEQVLTNLVVNSRDSMPKGGKLTIETQDVVIAKEMGSGLKAGSYVMLAVSDTGCGMTPAIQARAFEPFFTTKAKDKGTGLGLSTVYGIIAQSGGHINLYSEPGVGTAFKIYLPQVSGPADSISPVQSSMRLKPGTETILLVEDETLVRRLSSRILLQCGYQILEAQDGKTAIELAKKTANKIHLILTDVVMPKMSGLEMSKEVLKSHPEARVLYTSGYTDDAIVHHGILEPGIQFLSKPYSPQALSAKVRAVLDAA